METLVQRLVQNPHDQDAITYAHHSGQSDPRSYAMLLEKVGTATSDPAFSSHWLTEAANVWATTLGDAHRAARALMIAIDRDPTQPTPAERLAELYRDKGDTKALVALLERRAKALAPMSQHDAELRAHVAGIHEELGRLWSEAPLAQAKKATENYKRAIEYDPNSQYAIYAIRELHKGAGQFSEALPYFAMEQRLISGDIERQLALYQDEAEVRKSAGDLPGATEALRNARAAEGGQDAGLKQLLATSILERIQAKERVHPNETAEAGQLFIELAEAYPGDHGYSYAVCALEVEPGNDRAAQLAMYYAGQLGRENEVAPRAAAYVKANPQGAMAAEARQLVSRAMAETGGDDTMIDALAPPPGAESPERVRGLLDVAEALARKNKKHEAAAKYKEVLTLEPSNEEAVAFLEGHLRQTRKYAELRDVLLAASRGPDVDEDTKKGWLREVAGLCETQLRDIETAIHAWKQLMAIDSADEAARGQLRRLLERGGRWDDLATLLEQEAEQTADVEGRISMEKALAKIHEQKRKDPVATGETWARIAGLSPDDEVAITTSVRHFEKAERFDLAAQVIGDNVGSVTDERARAQLYKKLGELREATGNSLQAGEAFAEGAVLARDPALWEAAERAFVAAQNWEQAAQAIDERAQLTPKDKDRAALFALES
jgi:cellulose synthase operon protein C